MARTLLVAMEEDIEEERAMIRESLKLNIYDLTCMNDFMYWVGLGVYHSSIEAYGTEYAYGAHDYPTSGVFEVEPRQCPGFKFRKSLTLGTVWMGPEKFREFVEEIACEYTGDSYHLLSKNCNHFCDVVCMRLVRARIPRWINRLANIGSLCSCFLPATFQDEGIHPFDYEVYKNDAKHNQEKFEHLANPLAMVAPKKKHLGMDLTGLNTGLIVTARFPGLLPEYTPYLQEIGSSLGYVVADSMVADEDKTNSMRLVLSPSLVKDPPQFVSLSCIHGGDIWQRVVFIGLPGHCFVCGRKGHVAAECTTKVPSRGQITEQVRESQPQPSVDTVGSKGKSRSEA